jgi:hypothetical protein
MQSYASIAALRETLRQAPIPSATSENTNESLPKISLLAQIVGAEWMRHESWWFSGVEDMPHPVWYEQAELDLTALADKVPIQKLASCYRPMLRDRHNFIDAVYEIHGAALLAGIGQRVDLHVPRGPNEKVNYDVRVEIDGVPVQADCKAGRDEFPFKPHLEDPEGGYSGSRASLDPNDPAALGLTRGMRPDGMKHLATPESTVVRQLLESALTQLPDAGVNMVLFGQVDASGGLLERALLKGAPVAESLTNRVTKKLLGTRWRQGGTTVFGDARFARLSGVLWMRLLHLGGRLRPYYNLYVNPNAEVPMPPAVIVALNGEIKQRSSGDG